MFISLFITISHALYKGYTWILSGTIPTLIYYGLNILSLNIFLPTGIIICSLTSLVTGTSWGTVGTVGLALMGIGESLGIPSALTAINSGYTIQTNVETVDKLILRGGVQSMMWTFSLAFIALSLGGVLDEVGYLNILRDKNNKSSYKKDNEIKYNNDIVSSSNL